MTKPVDLTIQFSIPPGQKAAKASIRPNGDLLILDEDGNEIVPESMSRTVQYSRKKGPKIQNQRHFRAQYASIGGLLELSKFDSIFVIDTNTKRIGSDMVSATCFVCCRLVPDGKSYRLECEPTVNIYEFRNVSGSAEMLGILKVSTDVTASEGYSPQRRFAVVTDTELNKHQSINSRDQPVYGAHLLPVGFELIYASSDTGQEVLNRIIRFCDKQATHYLKLFEESALPQRELRQLREDPTVLYSYVFRNDLEIVNPVVNGLKLQDGAKISLYGVR
jgi:hypothetical protein